MSDLKDRLIRKKEEWARERRGLTQQAREEGIWVQQNPQSPQAEKPRLPPGQHLVKGFPILDLGIQPDIPLENWKLSIKGLVKSPVIWTWEDFLKQPQIEEVSDFHCVTTWSTFDNWWEGISFRHIIETVQPLPEVRYLFFTSYDGYSTNLPLAVCDDEDVMLAIAGTVSPWPASTGDRSGCWCRSGMAGRVQSGSRRSSLPIRTGLDFGR